MGPMRPKWRFFPSRLLAVAIEKCFGVILLDREPSEATHAGQILGAVAHIVLQEGRRTFTRKVVRDKIGLSADEWMAGYTAIFQAMRPAAHHSWQGQ